MGAGSGDNMVTASVDDMSCPGTRWINTLPSVEEVLYPCYYEEVATSHDLFFGVNGSLASMYL